MDSWASQAFVEIEAFVDGEIRQMSENRHILNAENCFKLVLIMTSRFHFNAFIITYYMTELFYLLDSENNLL